MPPRYSFALNPHSEMRCTRCPQCERPTRLRKFVLLIGVEEFGLIALGKTCRFCPACDFIIIHQDELETVLAANFATHQPKVIGNKYYVIGTMERASWRHGMRNPTAPSDDLLNHAADFKKEFDLHYQPGGWYPASDINE